MAEARRRRCYSVAPLWRGARAREKARPRVSAWVSGEPRALPFGVAGRDGTGGLPPCDVSGLGAVGHDGQ